MNGANRTDAKRSSGMLIYLLVFVSLQIFLMVVAVEGVISHEPGLSRAAAVLSALVFGSALALNWFLRHG